MCIRDSLEEEAFEPDVLFSYKYTSWKLVNQQSIKKLWDKCIKHLKVPKFGESLKNKFVGRCQIGYC